MESRSCGPECGQGKDAHFTECNRGDLLVDE